MLRIPRANAANTFARIGFFSSPAADDRFIGLFYGFGANTPDERNACWKSSCSC